MKLVNLDSVMDILRDVEFAESIAIRCKDPAHDIRWCSTCSARDDGIDEYRTAIIEKLDRIEQE